MINDKNDKNHEIKQIAYNTFFFSAMCCLFGHACMLVTFKLLFTDMTHPCFPVRSEPLPGFPFVLLRVFKLPCHVQTMSVSVKDREKCIIVTRHPPHLDVNRQTAFTYGYCAINSDRDIV